VRFYEQAPLAQDATCRTWMCRGHSAVVAYSEAQAGAVFTRADQVDEWVLLLPDASSAAEITVGGARHQVKGNTISCVPPGPSSLRITQGGRVVRLFTTQSPGLAAQSANAAQHEEPDPNVPPFVPWPAPPGGVQFRSYDLAVPDQPGRFGRIWRCTTFMVNVFNPVLGPRDITKLSPHHHDDFEQYSLALQGSFIHHLRWAWTPNMKMWRNDEHEFCGTPSVAIIPPPAIHTTRSLDPGPNLLVDIFSPPRMDFTAMPGWVLNNGDYPQP
jgi:hypothetical protein